MSNIIFLLIFISIFGPKIGLIDLAVLGYCFIGFILLSTIKRIKYPKEYVVLCMLGLILLLYSIIIALSTQSYDLYPVMRNFRAFLALGVLGLTFYNIRIPTIKIVDLVIIGILIHSIVILMQMKFPVLKFYIGPIVNYDKEFFPLRTFGIVGDYDGSGFLLVIGAILSLVMFQYTGFIRYIAYSFIFFTSVIFVSRMNMFLMLIVIIFSIPVWFNRKKVNLKIKFIVSSLLIGSGYIFMKLIYPILYYTVPMINQYFTSTSIKTTNYSMSYGSGGQAYLLDSMWKIPENIAGFFFGTGSLPVASDIGYVKILFMLGITGSFIIIFFYSYIIKAIKKKLKIINNYHLNTYNSYIKNFAKGFMLILLLIFFINFKNLFFFSRCFHELIIILFFTFLADINQPYLFYENKKTRLYPI